MKKYGDFILALSVLIFSIVVAVIVVFMVFQKNGGSFFPKKQEEIVTIIKKTTRKAAQSYSDDDDSVGTIFIGDSRFVGMDQVCDIEAEDRQFVVAKIGKGYNWFAKDGLRRVEEIKKENTALTKWRYVVCLGVNDIGNIKSYLEEYDRITDEDPSVQLILVSVNPVQDYTAVTNSQIKKFNSKLMDSGYDYIDTYSALVKKGYETTDGLHYTNATYDDIYDFIKKGLADL